MADLLLQEAPRIQGLGLAAGPSKIAGDIAFIVVDTIKTEALRPWAELGFDIRAEHLSVEPWRMKIDPAPSISVITGIGRVGGSFDDMSMNAVKHPLTFSTETMFELQSRTDFTLQAATRHGVSAIEVGIEHGLQRAACASAQPLEFRSWLGCSDEDCQSTVDATGFVNVSRHGGD